jgi:hypothetical protein
MTLCFMRDDRIQPPELAVDRRISAIKKDRKGNIVALCNPGEAWSPRRTADVVRDISRNQRSYYVEGAGRRTYVRLLSSGDLETTSDTKSQNHLGALPVC